MKLFTFSGVSFSFTGTNAGDGLIDLARAVVKAFPSPAPEYHGVQDQDHFRSFVNLGTLLGEIEDAVRLTGSGALNAEAIVLAEKYGKTMAEAMAINPKKEVLIMAHSQGTNNAVFSLQWLINQSPQFFAQRTVRCVLFDPKVGRNHMERLFGTFPKEKLSFLFIQSQNDILGNQALFVPKLTSEFPHGDHIWVKGLDHGSIEEWATLKKQQKWLKAVGYVEFTRAHARKIIELRREMNGRALNTTKLLDLQRWVNRYPMNKGKITDALLGFLQGELPSAFRS